MPRFVVVLALVCSAGLITLSAQRIVTNDAQPFLKQLFPTGRWFPFFTAISVMGVSLGVMVLVIVTSVIGGFGHELRRMIVQT